MATTTDYLTQLQEDKDTLVDNLTEQGITGLTGDETFTELVPKVLDIESGGGDLSEYFNNTASYSSDDRNLFVWRRYIKKLPNNIKFTGTTLNFFFKYYLGQTLNLSNFDVSNVTDMEGMFAECSNLYPAQLKQIENWDVSKVTNPYQMFNNAPGPNPSGVSNVELDLSSWRPKSIRGLFYNFNINRYSSINLTGLVSASCTDCSNVFNNSFSNSLYLPRFIISNWDATNVTTMERMFACSAYNSDPLVLDLSGITTSTNLINTNSMFSRRRGLTKIDMRNFDFTGVTAYVGMFGGSASDGPPNDCEIIVKDETQKAWITSKFTRLTNVKTVAEIGE